MLLGPSAAVMPYTAHVMVPAVANDLYSDELTDVQADGIVKFPSCQNNTTTMPCYGPDQIRVAYGVQPVLDAGITGAGQTIVIIDAFGDPPTIRTDLDVFNSTWSLQPTDATNLLITAPDGQTTFTGTPEQITWGREIATDVEWAHVIAPGATIHLVLAKSGSDADILSATRFAVDNDLGDVISQSFGEAESCADPQILAEEHRVFQAAHAKGMILLAASGDFGAAERDCSGNLVPGVSTPASDPLVTAVGGTTLHANAVSGAYLSESGWGNGVQASGGGFSTLFKRPGYQAPFFKSNDARGLPDVAWSADKNAALIRVMGRTLRVTGTSIGTPQWAGVAALANQAAGHRLPPFNVRLYHAGKSSAYPTLFHDITTGDNTVTSPAGPVFSGFPAGPGWDPITGLGSPNVAALLPFLSETPPADE